VGGILNVNSEEFEARKQWNTHPCGIGEYLDGIEYGSLEFFDAISRDIWRNY
jgi:hypothetical protein